jgi:hypothetical protein
MEVTQEELEEWRNHKITKYLFEELDDTRESLKDYLADGKTLETNDTARIVGQIQGVNQAFVVVSEVEWTE